MRLSKIKLAGFKSFVDPTTIHFPSNLTGVVGPNGCGKSNVIDAVRWVMGESSAKHLRGDQMADVIFNGSNARKPVGQASIELVFDNSEGALGGQYANYNEISIKRQVSRDGQSHYYLNGTRCRRRDITDIFLGTGLGPRSYAIIEQGTISRLIEAKPDELRAFLEEAAGISKYKERRRETENRIRHTRDNLDRLNDLRDEVEKQLERLQRQAKTAERYKELKQDERRLKAELLVLKWQAIDAEVTSRETEIREQETEYERLVAEQRSVESELERAREQYSEGSDALNEVQGRYYSVGAEIARVEQSIQHNRDMQTQQRAELEKAERSQSELEQQMQLDRCELEDVERELSETEPKLDEARKAAESSAQQLSEAEEAMQQWQARWDDYSRRAAEVNQQAEVERTRIDHIERELVQLDERVQRLTAELQELDETTMEREITDLADREQGLSEQATQSQTALESLRKELASVGEENERTGEKLEETRGSLQQAQGRLASLEALQQAALHQGEHGADEWLANQGLSEAPRLVQEIDVAEGWEKAVETALGHYLEALCVDAVDPVVERLGDLAHGSVILFERGPASEPPEASQGLTPLAEKVDAAALDVRALLHGVYAVTDLPSALAARGRLHPHESVVTPEGIWLGRNWLRVARDSDETAGMIAREREITELRERVSSLSGDVEQLQRELEAGRERANELERQRDEAQTAVNQAHRDHAGVKAQLESRRDRAEDMRARREQLNRELEEARERVSSDNEALSEARGRLEQAVNDMERMESERQSLEEQRVSRQETLAQARETARSDRETAQELALKAEQLRTRKDSMAQGIERMQSQLEEVKQRASELSRTLSEAEEPLQNLEQERQSLLERHHSVETELSEARHRVETVEAQMRELDERRAEAERRVQEARQTLEQARLSIQEQKVRRQTLQEQLDETGYERGTLLGELAEDANVEAWEEKVQQIENRIQRLGAINLAAIDEYEEESERKRYLDAQHQDLTEALETLENAIKRIDRETRNRFKETYDQVNSNLQQLFPRLFGGGNAHLEMTSDDVLEAGITVMARPPGKRISTIHLLSGGEKALTAVALVFSLFQLNPAPFCMLDEVDAPLDDANVGRFCDLVRDMADAVQFVLITHNKTTMELASQLTGVTMNEPGVSRLVAVDVDEAYRMAAV